jgi:hypothetical protein
MRGSCVSAAPKVGLNLVSVRRTATARLAETAALIGLFLLARPAFAQMTLTGTVSPSQVSYVGTLTYTANASGGDPSTTRFAFFRRRPGGTWIPDVNAPTWQSSNVYSWHPTLSDVGTWETYIWVKDGNTPSNQNTYGYAAGYNTMPIEVFGPPTTPGPTTVACAYTVSDECWVTGDFVASVSPSSGGLGSISYNVCRSNDTTGWGGCDSSLTLSGGTSYTVSGSQLPPDGYRRAYYFRAGDSAGAWSGWNSPIYVRVDRYAPAVSAGNASSLWYSYRTATVSASDSGSGVQSVRYSWNSPLDGNCSTGTATSSGATLTAPNGDNLLYLCARDNTGRVGQWSGQYRVSPMGLTGSVSPTQASYLGSFTWTMSASGGTPSTTRYAFFRRRPGGTWLPSIYSPAWQSSNVYTWTPAQSDVGTWETYVWVKDGDTPPDANGYGYAAGFNTMPIEVVGPPSVPGPTTTACAYWVASTADCWVAGDFTVSAAASTGGMGSLVYQICRSNDTTGWGGCDVSLTLSGGTSLAISATNLPADGYRRAYYFQAKDSAGALSGWNSPAYVRVDRYAPAVSASNASDSWFPSRTATVSASDVAGGAGANSGLLEVRYAWNTALDAACTTGTVTSSGATLTAPVGDNLLYLCTRDNVQRVTQWNGRYRVSAPLSLTGSITPSQASYLNSFTYTANAGGGDPATIRYAFFRRRPGGTWIPDVNAPTWQVGNTYSWAPTQADAGTWETYIWVKDANTPANQNTYGYAAGFNTMPVEVVGPPTVPGPTTVACAYWLAATADCWVTTDFTASVTASTGGMGSLVYQICRSNDSAGGWAGCDVNLTLSGGTSLAISATNLPSDGYRRAYYFQAKDSAGALSGWNVPQFVRVDRYPPTVSATNASSLWFSSRTATLSASDATGGAGANSGVQAVRYSWNTALDANCTTGTATSSGTTLTAPAGDNVLYVCARDNTGRIAQWSGQYRIAPMTLTGSVSPSRASYLGSFTWTMSASGGTPATTRYAFFHRRTGGTWIPDVNAPAWQSSNVYTWTPAQADAGTWETYVWVKDGDTPPDANGYGYAAGFNTMPIEVVGPPTVPGATTVACAYSVAATADCWVTGDITASVTASTGGMGTLVYQICRSNDSAGGAAGCDVNLTLSGGTSLAVSATNLPSEGYRRAYFFQAKDTAGALSGWNTPAYVRVDRYAPTVSASNASDDWLASSTATITAGDAAGGAGANSGLQAVRYSWNALDAACTTGTATTSGTTLTAPSGDNVLYLCARDNVARVTQWSGRYRVANSLTLTGSIAPSRASYLNTFTYTASATGGDPATLRYAFFRRRPGGTWIPDVNNPTWLVSPTYTWAPTQADVGTWETYIWVKDGTTPANQNGYGYAAGFNTMPVEVMGPPTVPGPTTVACAYTTGDECWVAGDFTASVTASTGGMGGITYQICRSNDTSGWGGCDVNLTLSGGTSLAITAADLPADGFRRAYYFQAKDSAGALSGWNSPVYVRVDRNAPTISATNPSDDWFSSRTATISAGDAAGSGLQAVRYSWNTVLDAACTTGTVTSSGATLTAPSGDNVLYLCAKDNVARVTQWSGRYRVQSVPAPEVTSVTPTVIHQGGEAILTVLGSHFQGASVYIATEPLDGDGTTPVAEPPTQGAPTPVAEPPTVGEPTLDTPRTFPSAELLSVNAEGTMLTVRINAQEEGIDGFYNLVVETPGGKTAGQFQVVEAATLTLTGTIAPTKASLPTAAFTYTATASGGDVATRQFAFFRRRSGGTWIPDVHNPTWQAANTYTWNATQDDVGTWETYIWVKDVHTPADANGGYGYAAGFNTGPIEVLPALACTTTPSPSQAPFGDAINWTVTCTGGDPATRQFALFRRRPGGTWIPDVNNPTWQAGNGLTWTPGSPDVGPWENYIWVKDATTPANANTYGYAVGLNPGPTEIVAPPPSDFQLDLTPSAATITRGGSAQFTITLMADAGFTGSADLSVSDLPAGFTPTLQPATIGAGGTATLTVATTSNTPQGISEITVTGTAGDQTRSATAQLRVVSPQAPVLTRITPDAFPNGGRVRVTVEGSFLSGATVSIGQEQADPDHPKSRVFPTAQVVSINPTGTSMEVEIDATDPRIIDFHTLVVDNGTAKEAIPFRVLPGGPLPDAWTPSEPEVGRLHALSIAGRNLAGTTITPSVSGRIRLYSVETSDTEITALLEVLPDAPPGPMKLIISDSIGRTAEVAITIVLPAKSSLKMHNLTASKDGKAIAGGYHRRPAVWFQEFVIRDPDKTEVLPDGSLRVRGIGRAEIERRQRAAKSISWDFYIHVTIPLVHVQWQKVILFDPVTGAIGDAILQGLGLGGKVPIGAFVLSAYFELDLTVFFQATNFGFTFPLFCIEISYGIEVTGFDGFAYHTSFCVGGGWYGRGKGSLTDGEITGGDCAGVTPTSFQDGVLEATVEQDACCSQPIGVAMSGHTFSGLPWGKSFSVNNPQAGTTTSNQASCSCPCTVSLDGTALTPGGSTSGRVIINNVSEASSDPCTYQYEVKQDTGQTQMDLDNNLATVTVESQKTATESFDVFFPQGRPAPDVATLKAEIQYLDADGNLHPACQATKISCVYPDGETSQFAGWSSNSGWDAARFFGNLTPAGTSFAGRTVTEGNPNSGTGSFDNCWFPGSAIPDYRTANLTGGKWGILAGNIYDDADLIGFKVDFDGYYKSHGRVPCSAGTTQTMYIYCGSATVPPFNLKPYTTNDFLIEATPSGTRVTRHGVTSTYH